MPKPDESTSFETVLEIGSGSFKLYRHSDNPEEIINERFESSLGRNLGSDGALDPESLAIALKNLDEGIIPLLNSKKTKIPEVIVFATAAIRRAMRDPAGSGEKFIKELEQRGFQNIKVFSEDDEARYAALAVIDGFKSLRDEGNFAVLDTGGASHQLVEVQNWEAHKMVSFPIGSHNKLFKVLEEEQQIKEKLPNFIKLGFQKSKNLVCIGTSGRIIGKIPGINLEQLRKLRSQLLELDIEGRRKLLKDLIKDTETHKLFLDFRLAIMPNAFSIIINCAENLGAEVFLSSQEESRTFISKYGII